jgi:hypothetical protein
MTTSVSRNHIVNSSGDGSGFVIVGNTIRLRSSFVGDLSFVGDSSSCAVNDDDDDDEDGNGDDDGSGNDGGSSKPGAGCGGDRDIAGTVAGADAAWRNVCGVSYCE